jgi:hypothetical protein
MTKNAIYKKQLDPIEKDKKKHGEVDVIAFNDEGTFVRFQDGEIIHYDRLTEADIKASYETSPFILGAHALFDALSDRLPEFRFSEKYHEKLND